MIKTYQLNKHIKQYEVGQNKFDLNSMYSIYSILILTTILFPTQKKNKQKSDILYSL